MGSTAGTATVISADFDNFTITPEPSTLSLLALGGLGMLRLRRR
jgi:hypothetical protein